VPLMQVSAGWADAAVVGAGAGASPGVDKGTFPVAAAGATEMSAAGGDAAGAIELVVSGGAAAGGSGSNSGGIAADVTADAAAGAAGGTVDASGDIPFFASLADSGVEVGGFFATLSNKVCAALASA